MAPLAAALLLFAAGDTEAALADRARFELADHSYLYYATAETRPAEQQAALIATFKFAVSSFTRDPNVDDHLPQRVTDTLYRLDTRSLGWQFSLPQVLVEHYPYAPHLTKNKIAPLVFRMDWFTANIGDEVVTGNSQFLLLFGKDIKTRNEWVAALGLRSNASGSFGFVEGNSGVRRSDSDLQRVMQSNGADRSAWLETFDSAIAAGETDALEFPDVRPPKHEATELFAPLIKVGRDADGNVVAGTLYATFLANGNVEGVPGARQPAAPVAIVEDPFGLRGYDIRNWIDCFSCHDEGLKRPTLDAYREAIVDGVRINVIDHKEARNIDRYYQSAFYRDVERGIEDFAAAMKIVNGLTPQQNAINLRQVIRDYDGKLSRSQAADELCCTVEELSLAVTNYVETYKDRNLRISRLAEGGSISRQQFELNYHKLQSALNLWRSL